MTAVFILIFLCVMLAVIPGTTARLFLNSLFENFHLRWLKTSKREAQGGFVICIVLKQQQQQKTVEKNLDCTISFVFKMTENEYTVHPCHFLRFLVTLPHAMWRISRHVHYVSVHILYLQHFALLLSCKLRGCTFKKKNQGMISAK